MILKVNALNSPYAIVLKKANTINLPEEDIHVVVDSSGGPVSILLPLTADFKAWNVRIFIQDVAGFAAINNITILTSGSDTINAAPSIKISTQNGFARCYIGANELWTATLASSGGGGGSALQVSMTYAQLIASMGSSSLVPGQQILLTDYATAYYLQYSGPGPTGIGGEQVNVGAVEPLVLTAISVKELSPIAQSITFPQDVIIYTAVQTDGNYEYAASQGKGCIIKRKDLQYEITRDYDWRTILFRRWETAIGSGNYWSYLPVAGAEYVDHLCFVQGTLAGQANAISISSVLSNHDVFGAPYWLDNTVVDSPYSFENTLTQAFGNTIVCVGGIFVSNYSRVFVSNIFVSPQVGLNSFNISIKNTVDGGSNLGNNNINEFERNTLVALNSNNCVHVISNTCNTISDNNVNTINSNSMVSHSINNNICGNISGNTCKGDIYQNDGTAINNNSCGAIYNNVVDIIATNTSSGTIYGNIAQSIQSNKGAVSIYNNTVSNSIDNNANTTIHDNFCGKIDQNVAPVVDIRANFVGTIELNSNAGSIFSNVVNVIDSNTNTGDIGANSGNTISRNSNDGEISRNNVRDISLNLAPVTGIFENSGNQISQNTCNGYIVQNITAVIVSNSNGGYILQNSGSQIEFNMNGGNITNNNVQVIVNNLGTGGISINVGRQIAGNNVSGDISNNNANYILSNVISSGEIMHNVADHISGNTLTGNISSNSINKIQDNTESTASSIVACVGGSFSTVILGGAISNTSLNQINGSTIVGVVDSHNFIDIVATKIITPTPTMSSVTPTRSILDESDSMHYIMLLSAGALTFPTAITN